jgi:hypothetical protein
VPARPRLWPGLPLLLRDARPGAVELALGGACLPARLLQELTHAVLPRVLGFLEVGLGFGGLGSVDCGLLPLGRRGVAVGLGGGTIASGVTPILDGRDTIGSRGAAVLPGPVQLVADRVE